MRIAAGTAVAPHALLGAWRALGELRVAANANWVVVLHAERLEQLVGKVADVGALVENHLLLHGNLEDAVHFLHDVFGDEVLIALDNDELTLGAVCRLQLDHFSVHTTSHLL